ncbi:BZ3500_MvSof-1268-A1-R1_Chr3-3g06586 [Microbotryum saponariae]|uniref:BZ3500_MvSof-1268-A1-R1_Chr3-3g06586 protein n=1 Tax=Microbotryum saponariae TaxID=289078 RepID=A0A2X0LGV2_9BASI|nr:BZ3500_MvSof-1268-A1-R1_Chr3-3g06586 [Microbotryum saponariae]SDA04553.1 BZ3501_MvSof-1269-A2-R1_Chr3-2g06273 [Microbotryum saponariae]
MFAFMEENRKDNSLLNPPLPLPMSFVTLTPRSRPSTRSAHSPNRRGQPSTHVANHQTPTVAPQTTRIFARHHPTTFRRSRPTDPAPVPRSFCIVCGSTSLDHPPTQLCHEFDPEAFTRSSSGALYHESSKPQVCFAFTR